MLRKFSAKDMNKVQPFGRTPPLRMVSNGYIELFVYGVHKPENTINKKNNFKTSKHPFFGLTYAIRQIEENKNENVTGR